MTIDPSLLSKAIVIWTGLETDSPWPLCEEALLVERFGSEMAAELLPSIRKLEEEFYESDARDRASDLAEMGDLAANDFRKRHPEISEEAIQALAWRYTFDYK